MDNILFWVGGLIIVSLVLVLMIMGLLLMRTRQKLTRRYLRLENEVGNLKTEKDTIEKEKAEIDEKYNELLKHEEKTRKIAYLDMLTGLPSKVALEEMLESTLKTLRKDEMAGLIYADVDNLKRINDRLGRSAGDELLVDVAGRFRQGLEEDDFLSCIGGGCFMILSQNLESTENLEEKIKKIYNVFSFPFSVSGSDVFISLNIGVCLIPKDGKTTQTLMKNLDAALYEAKKMGENNYCYYDESFSNELMEKIQLQSELRNAIADDQFEIYYQPQVVLQSEEINGFEALIRWNHPERGIVLPDEFLPVAEESGLLNAIENQVLLQVNKDIVKLKKCT